MMALLVPCATERYGSYMDRCMTWERRTPDQTGADEVGGDGGVPSDVSVVVVVVVVACVWQARQASGGPIDPISTYQIRQFLAGTQA